MYVTISTAQLWPERMTGDGTGPVPLYVLRIYDHLLLKTDDGRWFGLRACRICTDDSGNEAKYGKASQPNGKNVYQYPVRTSVN